MKIQPYLFFDGRCEEAVQFYQRALGAKVEMMMRYKEGPPAGAGNPVPANYGEKIMHTTFRVDDAVLTAADDCPGGAQAHQGFALTLSVADEPMARRRFDALADGGQVVVPLGKTFFAPAFGMLNDRFGVQWMVMVQA